MEDYFKKSITSFLDSGDDVGAKNDEEQHISLVETNGWFNEGISFDRFMEAYESMDIEKPLRITLKTYGGKVTTFLPIARVLSKHKGKLTVVIDRYAYSGGTILALMCDTIVMTDYSNLGGINPYYLIPINSNHIKRASDAINNSWVKVLFEYATDVEKSVIAQLESMLSTRYKPQEIEEIIRYFVYGVDHNTPLYYESLPKVIQKKILLVGHHKSRDQDMQSVDRMICIKENELIKLKQKKISLIRSDILEPEIESDEIRSISD